MNFIQRVEQIKNFKFHPLSTFKTNRLNLRELRISDTPEIHFQRSNESVNKFLVRKRTKNLDDAREFIVKWNKMIQESKVLYWAICLNNADRLIGTIVLWNFKKEHLRAEIGYELHPDYQGKGLMQEAIQCVLDYAFNVLMLHSVEAVVLPENIASVKILERNHFVREAYLKENCFHDGKFIDTAIYSLINETDKL